MVLRGRLDLRCVRVSKSFKVIDSHNALIQVISTTAELAAQVSTSCGLPAFRVSFLHQCSTLTGADRSWLKYLLVAHTNQPCWCRCRSPVSKPESVNVVQRSSAKGTGQIVMVMGTA